MVPSSPIVVMIAASIMFGAPPAFAASATSPDWPCVQRKIATLTSTQMWDGAASRRSHRNGATTKQQAKLIAVLASRRVPLEQATAAIAQFAAAQSSEKRDDALKLLFAGLLSTVNSDRAVVISGIERFPAAAEGARYGNREARGRNSAPERAGGERREGAS